MATKSSVKGWFSKKPSTAVSKDVPIPIVQKSYHPLDRERIAELLSLEDLFVKGLLSRSKVETLLDIYRICAEYYDSIKDPINIYFTEKIQYTVSQKSILALLSKPRTNSGVSEDTLATMKRKEEEEHLRRTAVVANDTIQRRDTKLNLESVQMLRSQKVKMGFEIDQQLQEQTDKAQTMLHASVKAKKDNDELINKNLENQKEAIRQKIEQRRTSSFMKSRSRANTSAAGFGGFGGFAGFKQNNTIGDLDMSQNGFGDSSMISIGKLDLESPYQEKADRGSSSAKKDAFFSLFGDVLNDPELKGDYQTSGQKDGDIRVAEFQVEPEGTPNIYGGMSGHMSQGSEVEKASTTNILNGCPVKKPTNLLKGSGSLELAGDEDILHNIYSHPSPQRSNGRALSPTDKNQTSK